MILPARLSRADLRLARSAPTPHDGWASRWTTVADIATHERFRTDPADGMPVVLLHGLAVSHRYLMPTAHALAGRHPVTVPDLPGFGLSGKPPVAFDVRRHAAHVAAWLDVRRLSHVCLVGHSFGAEVAAALARDRPDAVSALVLAGPTTDPAARTRRALVGRWCADLRYEDPRQALILGRDVRDARPWRVWATIGHSVRNAVEADLAEVRVPTLVLGGGLDPVTPTGWRNQAAVLTRGVSRTVPRAAHNALTTAGRQAADLIAGHLAGMRHLRPEIG